MFSSSPHLWKYPCQLSVEFEAKHYFPTFFTLFANEILQFSQVIFGLRLEVGTKMEATAEEVLFPRDDTVATDTATELSPLEEAAKNGDVSTVVDLINNGSLSYIAHKVLKDGEEVLISTLVNNCLGKKSALHYAAENGHAATVDILLEVGFDADAKIEPLSTDYHWGQLPKSKLERDRAVHLAARMGHIDVLRSLRAHGAIFNVPGERKDRFLGGYHPIHEACSKGHDEVVSYLLKCDGSVINVMTGVGFPVAGVPVAGVDFSDRQLTPLMVAAKEGNLSTVNLLIHLGDPFGVSGLFPSDGSCFLYTTTALHQAAKYGHVPIVALLIEHGMDLNARPERREETVLDAAITGGSTRAVRFLIERGVDVNLPNRDGKTALHSAVEHGHVQITRLLLKNGADPNVAVDGITPFWMAAKTGNCKIGKILLDKCVHLNIPNCPLSIVETAVGWRRWEFLQMFLERRPAMYVPQTLNSALRQILGEGDGVLGEIVAGSVECVRILLQHDATVEKFENVLGAAVEAEELELVEILFEYGRSNGLSLRSAHAIIFNQGAENSTAETRKRKRDTSAV